MTANAMCGMIGALLGGAGCFFLGYHCALRRVAAELERLRIDLDGHDNGEGDAAFAMRAIKGRPSATKTAQALATIRRSELEGEFRRMLGEGK